MAEVSAAAIFRMLGAFFGAACIGYALVRRGWKLSHIIMFMLGLAAVTPIPWEPTLSD